MNRIFASFIFIFINISVSSGSSRLGLVPDFVGYYLLMKGLMELDPKEIKRPALYTLSKILAIYSFILYILELNNITDLIGPYFMIPELLELAASFWLLYKIVRYIKATELKRKADFHIEHLSESCNVLCIGCFATLLMSYTDFPLAIRLAVNGIPYLWFLYIFYRAKERMLASE